MVPKRKHDHQDSDRTISKSIIKDVILNCLNMGVQKHVLINLHQKWLTKLKETDPDFYYSFDEEWSSVMNCKEKKININKQAKAVKRLTAKPGKENVHTAVRKQLKNNSKLNITKTQIALSMPLLDEPHRDKISSFEEFGRIQHPLFQKSKQLNIKQHAFSGSCFQQNKQSGLNLFKKDEEATIEIVDEKCISEKDIFNARVGNLNNKPLLHTKNKNFNNDFPINGIEEQASIKNDFEERERSCTINKDLKPNQADIEYLKQLGLNHLLFQKNHDEKHHSIGKDLLQNESKNEIEEFEGVLNNYYAAINNGVHATSDNDRDNKNSSFISNFDDYEHNFEKIPLRRCHSIRDCRRQHRQKLNEIESNKSTKCYQAICEEYFLTSFVDVSQIIEKNVNVVILLPDDDSHLEKHRTCMITVSPLLLKNNTLATIINPLLNKLNKFSKTEATFVFQKSVDQALNQMFIGQTDGPVNSGSKFRLVYNNPYRIDLKQRSNWQRECVDSDDDVTDEDVPDVKYPNDISCLFNSISRRKNIFYLKLRNLVITINGKDRYFSFMSGKLSFD